MFHVEQIIALLGVASACLGATPSASTPLPCPAREPAFALALTSDHEEVSRETALGLEALLYGDETSARRHFSAALAVDQSTPLPSVGLALLSHNAAERSEQLKSLRENFEHSTATPTEAFYLSAFLKLLEGKTADAAREFSDRADRYPRDHFSAAWAILLLHYSNHGSDAEGNSLREQEEALHRAKLFYQSQGKEFLPVCYLRAIVEESQPEISPQALEAASSFAEQQPGSAVALNLYAHTLYKSQRIDEAKDYFHRAFLSAREDKENDLPALRARLRESVASWVTHQDKDALKIRRELNFLKYDANALDERNIFLAWESHTLPVRILVFRETLPQATEIKAALIAASPKNNRNAAIECAATCIADTLYARIAFRNGKISQATNYLKKAENGLKKFDKLQAEYVAQSVALITPCKRLHAACTIAINKAKSILYSSTSDAWSENLDRAIQSAPSDSMLPEVIPSR